MLDMNKLSQKVFLNNPMCGVDQNRTDNPIAPAHVLLLLRCDMNKVSGVGFLRASASWATPRSVEGAGFAPALYALHMR